MDKRFWILSLCAILSVGVLWGPGCGPAPTGNEKPTGTPDGSIHQDSKVAEPNQGEPGSESIPEKRTTESKEPIPTKIDTKLDTNNAKAGETVTATCHVKDQYGAPITAKTRVKVTPEPRGFVKPTEIVIHEAGEYKVACQLVDDSLIDDSPETLTIIPASPETIDTDVSPIQVKAGEDATVKCTVKDRFGNLSAGQSTIVVTPKQSTTLKGTTISATKMGKYMLACTFGGLTDPSPAELDVIPNLPARIEVVPDPAKPFQKPEETIILERKIFDRYDNEIRYAQVSVSTTPDTTIDKSGYPDSITFKKDGVYQVTISVDKPTDGGKKVETILSLKVDGFGPEIAISTPVRAAMLTGSSTITIKGTVADSVSGVASLKVNGKTVRPDRSGAFTTTMTGKWGLNFIIVETTDKAGNAGYRAQTFLWSPKYNPMGSTKLARAIEVRLNQDTIDDGDRSTINDLGTILELVLNSIDIDKQVPSVLATGRKKTTRWGLTVTYYVKKNGTVTMGKRTISLKARTGGISFTNRIEKVRIPLRGTASKYLSKSLTIVGNVTLKGNINIGYSNGKVVVTIPSLSADVSQIKVNAFGSIFSFLNGLVTSALRSTIKSSLEKSVKSSLPEPIRDFFQGITYNRDFSLPAALANKVLKLESSLDGILFDSEGGTLGLAVSVSSSKGISSAKLGTPLRSQVAPVWGKTGYAFGSGISYNTVNQVLTASWYASALDRDISSKIPSNGSFPLNPQNLKVKLTALLPPILHPGTTGHNVDVGIGDLLLDVEFSMQGVGLVKGKAYLSARYGAKLGLSNKNEIAITLTTTPQEFAVDVIEVSGLGRVNIGDFGKLLGTLAPTISQLLTSNILGRLPIPSIDLAKLGGKYGIPAGASLVFTNSKLDSRNDYVTITGDLK